MSLSLGSQSFRRALIILGRIWVLEPKRSRFKFGFFSLPNFVT